MERGPGNDILASILDKGEIATLMSDMDRICADTEEAAALTDKFVPRHRQTQRAVAGASDRVQRRPSPPQRKAVRSPPPPQPPARRREYSVYDARAMMMGPPEGPEVRDYRYSHIPPPHPLHHHHQHQPPYPHYPAPEYHAPPPPPPPGYHDQDYYAHPYPQHLPPPDYDPYFYTQPRREEEYTYSVREYSSRTTTSSNGGGSSQDRYQHYRPSGARLDRRPGTIEEPVSITETITVSSTTKTETKVIPQAKAKTTNFSAPTKSEATVDIASFVMPSKSLVLPPQVTVVAPLFTEVETMDQGQVKAMATPVVVAATVTTSATPSSEPVTQSTHEVAAAGTAVQTPSVPTPLESVGPPEQKEIPSSLTEAVTTISGFSNLSKPCAVPPSDITDMSPLKTLRAEFHAERQMSEAVRAGVEVTEVGFEDKKQPPVAAAAPQESHALQLEDSAHLVQAAQLEKAHHEEAQRKKRKEVAESGEKKEKKKSKKDKEKKKHKKDKEEKKKHKEEGKKEKEDKKEKKHKKKDKKKKKKEDDGDESDGDKAKAKTGDKEKDKKKKHKEEKKKKKLEKRKKRREESLLADEASEAGSDEELEDGSLDSDEDAAEAENSDILSDTSGEDLSDEASDADEEGNLKDFIGDDIEYEEGASDEGEEIHGRNEHTKYAESGPRVMGKKARKLKKLAEEQEQRDRGAKGDAGMHKTDEIGASLLREQEQLYGGAGHSAKKGHKRHIEDDDIDEAKAVTAGGAKETKTMSGDSPSASAKTVPLSEVPTRCTGEPLKTDEIEPILCGLAMCIAGHCIAMWHSKESGVAKPKAPSASGYGPFSDDFIKYTVAMADGKVLAEDRPAASVFRRYFGPDTTPVPEDPAGESIENLCLNGLARRIIKEMGRVGLLPAHVAKLFTSTTPSENIPTLSARPDGENFVVSIYSNGRLVHEMAAAAMMKDALSQVFSWFKAFSVFEAITRRYVEKKYSVKLLHKKDIEYTNKCFIKSFDDIAGIINKKFVSSCDAEIHAAVASLLNAPTEAAEFLVSLRQS